MAPLPDWSRAWGPPLFTGRIRSVPEDFIVDEQLEIDFSGTGEHDWLHVEKTRANTQWVAEQLAKHAGVSVRDVGYSGLKDRHAVTSQWFSVHRRISEPTNWHRFELDGVHILEKYIHNRKLKRAAHRSNRFRIAVRSPDIAAVRDDLAERLLTISRQGVPNYFGEQRFGHGGANINLGHAVLNGRGMSRAKRSIGISALRSYQFNEALDERVRDGTWNRLIAGDVATLDGTGSFFAVDELTTKLEARCADMDVHPTGMLPAFQTIGVKASCRALRVRVGDLKWDLENDALWLEFSLGRGSYATGVIREIARYSHQPA